MNKEFLIYLMICFGLSFLIGIERQYRRRLVGLRTTILVSLGAFLFVSFSFSVGAIDISRIASQVVTGIGFLGAGVILKNGKKVQGLTTAATLWCDAAIGILCAGGAIYEAILGTIIILFANIILRYVNKIINDISDNKNTKYEYCLVIKTNTKENIAQIKKIVYNKINLLKLDNFNFNTKNTPQGVTLILKFLILKKEIISIEKFIDFLNDKYNLSSIELKKINVVNNVESEEEL